MRANSTVVNRRLVKKGYKRLALSGRKLPTL